MFNYTEFKQEKSARFSIYCGLGFGALFILMLMVQERLEQNYYEVIAALKANSSTVEFSGSFTGGLISSKAVTHVKFTNDFDNQGITLAHNFNHLNAILYLFNFNKANKPIYKFDSTLKNFAKLPIEITTSVYNDKRLSTKVLLSPFKVEFNNKDSLTVNNGVLQLDSNVNSKISNLVAWVSKLEFNNTIIEDFNYQVTVSQAQDFTVNSNKVEFAKLDLFEKLLFENVKIDLNIKSKAELKDIITSFDAKLARFNERGVSINDFSYKFKIFDNTGNPYMAFKDLIYSAIKINDLPTDVILDRILIKSGIKSKTRPLKLTLNNLSFGSVLGNFKVSGKFLELSGVSGSLNVSVPKGLVDGYLRREFADEIVEENTLYSLDFEGRAMPKPAHLSYKNRSFEVLSRVQAELDILKSMRVLEEHSDSYTISTKIKNNELQFFN